MREAKVNTRGEMEKAAREAAREDREKIEACQALLRNPHFLLFMKMLNNVIDGLGVEVLEPAKTMDDCVALEGVKGTMRGLIRARDLAHATVAGAGKGILGEEDDE